MFWALAVLCVMVDMYYRLSASSHYFHHPCDLELDAHHHIHDGSNATFERPANAIIIDEKGINLLLERLTLVNVERAGLANEQTDQSSHKPQDSNPEKLAQERDTRKTDAASDRNRLEPASATSSDGGLPVT